MNKQTDDEDSRSDQLLETKKPEANINQTKDVGNTLEPTPDAAAAKKKKYIKWGIIGAIILIAVILAIVLPLTLGGHDNPPDDPPFKSYNPYSISQKDVIDEGFSFEGTLKTSASYNSEQHSRAIDSLFSTPLKGTQKLGVKSNSIPQGVNNNFLKTLKFSMKMTTWKIAHFTLNNEDENRYEIPTDSLPKPNDQLSMRLDMLGFQYNLNPFSFSFVDPLDKSNVFLTTANESLVFMDKFIQMDFLLPSQRIFGFGERVHEFQLSEGTWTMWAIGQNSPYDDGTGRNGVYGVHPFILVQGKNKGDYIGLYFRNSNAQSPIIQYKNNQALLSYITTGGLIDVYFFIHGTAQDIIKMYQQSFGNPALPPFWSLGWQQASFKWKDQDTVENVIKNYTDLGFPLDTVYLDIPYMNKYLDFTVDTDKFPKLPDLAKSLHDNKQHLVVIIDGGISADDTTNKYYTEGDKAGVFIKSGQWKSKTYNNNLLLKVWSDKAVFVDWFNDKCVDFWSLGLNDLYTVVPFDGLWIDMNEPTGLGTGTAGEIKPDDAQAITAEEIEEQKQARFLLGDDNINYNWYKSFDQGKDSTYLLPFVPQFDRSMTGNFDNWTLSLNATHADKNTEYNYHNLYGHMMSKRTQEYLTADKTYPNTDLRPFVLTRSTFTGTGKYAAHWLGDNYRDWKYLKYSVAGIMNMNMFGISQVGADICGFFGKGRNDELCARWTQLATFYPLARFHYDTESDANEPYLMAEPYYTIAKTAMYDRYQYLRHMYTCMFEMSDVGGGCIEPLFFHFPQDDKAFSDIESSFMVGGALKVSPVLQSLDKKTTKFQSYFPSGKWVSLIDPTEVIDTTEKGGDYVNITDRASVNVHLKAGSLFAFQDNSGKSMKNTNDVFSKPVSIVVNRDDNGYAYGSVFLDTGSSRSEIKNNKYEYYQMHFQNNSIQFFLQKGTRGTQTHVFDKVKILNAGDLLETSIACYFDINDSLNPKVIEVVPHKDTNVLELNLQSDTFPKFSDVHSIHFVGDGEVNICDQSQSFAYKTLDGALPSLDGSSAYVILKHMGETLPNINLTLRIMDGAILNFNWTYATDANGSYPSGYKVPVEVPEDFISTKSIPNSKTLKLSNFISVKETPAFTIEAIYRGDKGLTTYFTLQGMLLDSYLNWIKAQVTTDGKGIFGLGERANKDFFFKDGVYSMWSRDEPTPDENGKLPGNNMYGTHPFFMFKLQNDAWYGVLYKLAQAQDWWIKNNGNKVNLNTIATGGVGDIYIMSGTTPDEIVQKYFILIGRPVLIPQWALGWNQCRWGYTSIDEVQAVVDGYKKNNLPLDVQWSDIDYLNKYRNFEYDTVNYKDLDKFIDTLHKDNKRYVPIIDAGLAARPNAQGKDAYEAYNSGVTKDVFMKINGSAFIGQVWPNDAVYPDYFAKNTSQWWKDHLTDLYDNKGIKFDGLWEDMNEASNFCNGVCYQSQQVTNPVKQNLKYVPTGRDLEYKSMSLDATHANGYQQIDTHSLYGAQEVKVTSEWFTQTKKMRPFIIERSSFAGSGKYASRWLGDNNSDEKSMAYSVSGIMLMNIFGIPMSGSDICGFIGNTTWELCTKWHVVGSFYPFSRNHNNWGQTSQEPWEFAGNKTDDTDVLDIMRQAIQRKYSLIRYYYSKFYEVSFLGGTFFKPLFFEYPDDDSTYNDIVYNVMLGDSLKLSINPSDLSEKNHDFLFPAGTWCGMLGTLTVGECFDSNGVGYTKNYPSSLKDYQVHIREGKIVPYQEVTKDVTSSVDLQSEPVDFHILGHGDKTSFYAVGNYFNDDGLTVATSADYQDNSYVIVVSKNANSFTVTITTASTAKEVSAGCTAINQNDYLQNIYFYNAANLEINAKYAVTLTDNNQKTTDAGSADVDANNRLSFKPTAPICMSTINTLSFTKAA